MKKTIFLLLAFVFTLSANAQLIVPIADSFTVPSGASLPVDDTQALVQDPADNTKQVRIDAGEVATGTTRTISMPDADIDLGLVNGALQTSTAADTPIIDASGFGGVLLPSDDTVQELAQAVDDLAINGGDALPIPDSKSVVKDVDDDTKQVRIDAGAISSGNTRTLMVPDANVNLGLVNSATQPGDNISTLTNNSGFLSSGTVGTANTIDASGFDGNLPVSTNTVQELAQAVDDLVLAGGGNSFPVDDQTFIVNDFDDSTKQIRLEAGAITPGETRSLIVPDADVNLGLVNGALQTAFAGVTPYIDASGFDGQLTPSDDTVQELAQAVDDLVLAGANLPVDDTQALVQDPADNTKQVRIDAGGVATGTTRTIIMPNANIDLGDIVPGSGNQSLRITPGADDATSFREVTFGQFGTEYLRQSAIAYIAQDRLMNIGGGASDVSRKDLLTVMKDGTVGVGVNNLEDSTDEALLQVGGLASSTATPSEIAAGGDTALVTTGFANSPEGFFDSDESTIGLVVTTPGDVYASGDQLLEWTRAGNLVDFKISVREIDGTTQTGALQIDYSATNLPRPSLRTFDRVFPGRINASGGALEFFDVNATFAGNDRFQFQGKTNLLNSNASSISNLDFNGTFGQSANVSGSYRTVETIAVILAGQSNMMGVGTPEPIDLTTNGRVLQTLGTTIRTCIEPTHLDTDVDAGVSPGLAFGKAVITHPTTGKTTELLILPAAVNGSSVSEWINDDVVDGVQLLTNFTNQVNLAQSLGAEVKAVLWQQGEVDSRNAPDTAAYGGREVTLMNQFRTIIGDPNLTIISGEIKAFDTSFGNELDPVNAASINSQKAANAAGDANWFLTDSSDFVTFDGVHFDPASNRLMGQRMADVFIAEGLN